MVASEVPSPCPISDPNDFYSVALVSALCEVINNMIIRGGGSALASIVLESPILLQSDRRHKVRPLIKYYTYIHSLISHTTLFYS